jgi:hypothetical protein
MGNKIKKGLTATQFYLHGKKNFTRTGWENASKNYVPGELENVEMKGKIVMITGANSGIGFSCAEFLASRGKK